MQSNDPEITAQHPAADAVLEPPPSASLTRRKFLRRSGSTLLTITLLDLVHPLQMSAITADTSCKGYAQNDPDGTCGKTLDDGKNDADDACNKVEADEGCGNAQNTLGSGALKDNDGGCGQAGLPNNQQDPDGSCDQTTSSSGVPESDEACDTKATGFPDQDEHCSSAQKDEACQGKGSANYDPDAHCGWGTPPERDQSCRNTESEPDSTNDPKN